VSGDSPARIFFTRYIGSNARRIPSASATRTHSDACRRSAAHFFGSRSAPRSRLATDRADRIHDAVEDDFPQIAPRGSATTRVGRPDFVISSPATTRSAQLFPRGPSQEFRRALGGARDGTVVARRFERYAVRDVEIREPHEYLLVAPCRSGRLRQHWPPLENRADRIEHRGPVACDLTRMITASKRRLPISASAREGRRASSPIRCSRELQAVLPDRLDVRAVGIKHGDVGGPGEGGRVEAAYRAPRR